MRLRTKGIIAFAAMFGYVALVIIVLAHERERLLGATIVLEEVYEEERALDRVEQAALHARVRFRDIIDSKTLTESALDDVRADIQHIQAGLVVLHKYNVKVGRDITALQSGIDALRVGTDLEKISFLREYAEYIEKTMEKKLKEVDVRHTALWADYRRVYKRMSTVVLVSGSLGAASVALALVMFFGRLTRDIIKLKEQARLIIKGSREEKLEIKRGDEVGDLARAVSEMQGELKAREQQVELMREQQFHKDKMAALGSLAAAVAHEINNPISAIEGITQSMLADANRSSQNKGERRGELTLILESTKKLASITRQISEMTSPRPPEPGLVDLNGLIRQTSKFASFDSRLRRVNLSLRLDEDLPALWGVADHLSQILLNLIINAADALEDVFDREPEIRVETSASDKDITLTVRDNGHGMHQEVLTRVFQEFFTTKPPEKGRGIGLFLCKTLVEKDGGRIEIKSEKDVGTVVSIVFPVKDRSVS